MKRIVLISSILCAVILCSCEQKTHIVMGTTWYTDFKFESDEINVYVTPKTDIVPIEFSRVLPPPEGKVDDNCRILIESPDSEVKNGTHYMVENWVYKTFTIYFEPGEVKGRYMGLHILPEKIDRNMKLILNNAPNRNYTLTINLIVDKENHEKSE